MSLEFVPTRTLRQRVERSLAALGVLACLAGCATEPCPAIPVPDGWSATGLVMDGGNVCEGDASRVRIHYRGDSTEVVTRYLAHADSAGWGRVGGDGVQSDRAVLHVQRDGATVMVTIMPPLQTRGLTQVLLERSGTRE